MHNMNCTSVGLLLSLSTHFFFYSLNQNYFQAEKRRNLKQYRLLERWIRHEGRCEIEAEQKGLFVPLVLKNVSDIWSNECQGQFGHSQSWTACKGVLRLCGETTRQSQNPFLLNFLETVCPEFDFFQVMSLLKWLLHSKDTEPWKVSPSHPTETQLVNSGFSLNDLLPVCGAVGTLLCFVSYCCHMFEESQMSKLRIKSN